MNDLLTTRQVQEILKVDRITVYRMLQDGRLKGVKIGQQWRFPQREVDRMVGGNPSTVEASLSTPVAPDAGFPTHCVQTIQDLFAEISQISALVVDMDGNPLTQVSHPTRFCQMLFSTTSGKGFCQASWKSFARDSVMINGKNGEITPGAKFFTCQAGLQYIGAPIFDKDNQVGLFLAGQFYWQAPDPREEAERIRRLAAAHDLPMEDLQDAAREIPVIDPSQHARVEAWPFTAARAIQSILHERLCFVERLQQIASLTQLS
jgi:excisionase family DNA binding protein